VNVGFDGLKLRVIDTEKHPASIRMPRYDANGKLALAQVPNDASAEKPGSAENGDSAPSHGLSGAMAMIRRSPSCTPEPSW
jgi:hypothetical protein